LRFKIKKKYEDKVFFIPIPYTLTKGIFLTLHEVYKRFGFRTIYVCLMTDGLMWGHLWGHDTKPKHDFPL
jgi:hypothetical protein